MARRRARNRPVALKALWSWSIAKRNLFLRIQEGEVEDDESADHSPTAALENATKRCKAPCWQFFTFSLPCIRPSKRCRSRSSRSQVAFVVFLNCFNYLRSLTLSILQFLTSIESAAVLDICCRSRRKRSHCTRFQKALNNLLSCIAQAMESLQYRGYIQIWDGRRCSS